MARDVSSPGLRRLMDAKFPPDHGKHFLLQHMVNLSSDQKVRPSDISQYVSRYRYRRHVEIFLCDLFRLSPHELHQALWFSQESTRYAKLVTLRNKTPLSNDQTGTDGGDC